MSGVCVTPATPEFLLHLDGIDAWWRWHDKPFDDT
jgi:hypothetical protein